MNTSEIEVPAFVEVASDHFASIATARSDSKLRLAATAFLEARLRKLGDEAQLSRNAIGYLNGKFEIIDMA